MIVIFTQDNTIISKDADSARADLISLYGEKLGAEAVGGKMILPPHGKEIFHAAVSSFLHPTVATFLHAR